VVLFRGAETHVRSVLKALSWRTLGTLDTFAISWLLTGRVEIAGSIAGLEIITKIALYDLHERVWAAVTWGRRCSGRAGGQGALQRTPPITPVVARVRPLKGARRGSSRGASRCDPRACTPTTPSERVPHSHNGQCAGPRIASFCGARSGHNDRADPRVKPVLRNAGDARRSPEGA
jgi:uncharacterized membrane protein